MAPIMTPYKPINEVYTVIPRDKTGDVLYELAGRDLEFLSRIDEKFVWTVMPGANDQLIVMPGIVSYHSIAHIMTEECWVNKTERYLF